VLDLATCSHNSSISYKVTLLEGDYKGL
jgi:hypothetical protein